MQIISDFTKKNKKISGRERTWDSDPSETCVAGRITTKPRSGISNRPGFSLVVSYKQNCISNNMT